VRIAVVLALTLLGCGRIGIEERTVDPGDALTGDSPVMRDDAPAACPPGTTPIKPGVTACVEVAERGNETWTVAKATCEGLGRRLCTDDEWAIACDNATGLIDMAGDGNWEWVADESGGIADKRGFDLCSDESAHEIFVDPYDYRCCLDL
jgi:hypothetical protein